MSVFKSTFSRALRAIPSDDSNIPYPSPIITSITTSSGANTLIDSSVNFISLGVREGDIVYNTSNNLTAIVLKVVSSTELSLNSDAAYSAATIYTVYASSPQSGLGNTGAFLYVGGTGNVSVITIGGDTVTFNAVPAGTTLPIQVLKLRATSTTATLINALW